MSKAVPLKNTAVAVVKSPQLPATPPKREYGDFDAFVENADNLLSFFGRISEREERLYDIQFEWVEWGDNCPIDLEQAKQQIQSAKWTVDSARHLLTQFSWARKRLAECKRDERWYDRKELYQIKGKGKREKWTLSRRVVSEQIAVLLGSFQNVRPGTPEAFSKMMIEEVYAANPNACVFESACRHLRRTEEDFAPSIAKVLKAIKNECEAWSDRWELLRYDGDDMRRDLEKAIAEAEAKIAPAEAKLAEREAKAKAEEERRKAYQEAYARIPKDEQQAYRDGQRDRSYNQNCYRDGPQRSMPEQYRREGREREVVAYCAGLAGKEIPGLGLTPHEREIDKARREVECVTRQIKSLAKEIDDAKATIEPNGGEAWLSDVIKRHAEAEKRESEASDKLQALLAASSEQEPVS
jgi:hypothetical protein